MGAAPFCAADAPCDPYVAVQSYSKFEKAMESLPRPLLVTCKTGGRAGAVVAAYFAVQRRMTVAEMEAYATSKGWNTHITRMKLS